MDRERRTIASGIARGAPTPLTVTSRIQKWLWTVFLVLVVNLALPSFGLPGVRLAVSSDEGNLLLLGLTLVPFAIVGNAFFLPAPRSRLVNLVVGILIALPSGLSGYWILRHGLGKWIRWGYELPTEVVSEAAAARSMIRVYRVSHGGGTGGDFFVRQERPLLLGLLIVRNIGPNEIPGEFKVDAQVTGAETVEIENEYYRTRTQIHVKPSWIFGDLGGR